MSRTPRQLVPGESLHIVRRGNNREACFYRAEDHALYLAALVQCADSTGCRVHGYVLMTNHVHLLLTPTTHDGASRCMHRLGLVFTKAVNRKYRRTGTLWEGRFHASPVTTDAYALACLRYIELNPVRAGLVAQPEQYRWSSHRTNIGDDHEAWLVPHPSLLALGRTRAESATRYRQLFATPIDDATLASLRWR